MCGTCGLSSSNIAAGTCSQIATAAGHAATSLRRSHLEACLLSWHRESSACCRAIENRVFHLMFAPRHRCTRAARKVDKPASVRMEPKRKNHIMEGGYFTGREFALLFCPSTSLRADLVEINNSRYSKCSASDGVFRKNGIDTRYIPACI
jgi:hypothetical protein